MKNEVLKVKSEVVSDEPAVRVANRLKQAAMALETSPDMQLGLTVLRRIHTEDGDRQSITIFFGAA